MTPGNFGNGTFTITTFYTQTTEPQAKPVSATVPAKR